MLRMLPLILLEELWGVFDWEWLSSMLPKFAILMQALVKLPLASAFFGFASLIEDEEDESSLMEEDEAGSIDFLLADSLEFDFVAGSMTMPIPFEFYYSETLCWIGGMLNSS